MPWPGRLEGGHELRVNKCTQPIVSGHRSQVIEARLASECSGRSWILGDPSPSFLSPSQLNLVRGGRELGRSRVRVQADLWKAGGVFSSGTKLLEWVVGTVGLFSKLGLSLLVGDPEQLNVLPASSYAV